MAKKLEIPTLREGARGCGWKKEGGLYLISGGLGSDCCKLPIRLEVCPTCGHGIKPSRGWTWIAPIDWLGDKKDRDANCQRCPLGESNLLIEDQHGVEKARMGLLWIGGSFYTPCSWVRESEQMGVSRRISAIPKDFVLGETWIAVAHREFWTEGDQKIPAIFHLFKPTAIQYIVKPRDGQKKLKRMIKRGITPVKIERVGEQTEAIPAKKKRRRKRT